MTPTDVFWLYMKWRLIEAGIGISFVAVVSLIYAAWKLAHK